MTTYTPTSTPPVRSGTNLLYYTDGSIVDGKMEWKAPVQSTYTDASWSTDNTFKDYVGEGGDSSKIRKNLFLITQQVFAYSGINAIYTADIDDRRIYGEYFYTGTDLASQPTHIEGKVIPFPADGNFTALKAMVAAGTATFKEPFKDSVRVHAFTKGGYADPLAVLNDPSRSTALFTNCAYASVVYWLNKDDPQFSGSSAPNLQLYVEGMKVKTFTSPTTLSSTKTYSFNPVLCLLDYLMNEDYGMGLSLDELDLPTFYDGYRICDQKKVDKVPILGAFWETKRGDRPVYLYECNLSLDTSQPLRENVNKILATMNDANLIWSGGKYKFLLDYPNVWGQTATKVTMGGTPVPITYDIGQQTQHDIGNVAILARSLVNGNGAAPGFPTWNPATKRYDHGATWEDAVDAYITDENLIRAGETVLTWPDAQSRLNFCTITFLNESKNFEKDTVSWPDKNPVDPEDIVYSSYLYDDSGMILEAEEFAEGATSYYTAKARAEWKVRSSRNYITYAFSVNRDFIYLEPGDKIKFQSDVMNIPDLSTLPVDATKYERAVYGDLATVRSVQPQSDGSIKITASRYDARILAWNINDDELEPDRHIFNSDLLQASNLRLDETQKITIGSPGRLYWDNSTDARVDHYRIKVAPHGIPSLQTIWMDLGNAQDGAGGFDLPALIENDYLLTVVAASGSRLAPRRGWPILDTAIKSTVKSVKLTASGIVFVLLLNGTWENESFLLTAGDFNYTNPEYKWYKDGTPIKVGEVLATGNEYTVVRADDFPTVHVRHTYKVEVREGGSTDATLFAYDTLTIFSALEGDNVYQIGFDDEDIAIDCDYTGNIAPADQLPYANQAYVIKGRAIIVNTEDDPYRISWAIEGDGATFTRATIDQTGKIQITELTEPDGVVHVLATVQDGGSSVEVRGSITVRKVMEGEVTPHLAKLSSDSPAFIIYKNEITPRDTEITVSDVSLGYSEPIRTWLVDGVELLSSDVNDPIYITNGGAAVIVKAFDIAVRKKTIKLLIKEKLGTLSTYDEITLFVLREGDDSVIIYTTEAVRVISAYWDGTIKLGGYLPFDTQIIIMKGIQFLQEGFGVVYSITEFGLFGSTVNQTTGMVTVGSAGNNGNDSMTAESGSGYIVVKAVVPEAACGVVGGLSLYQTITVVKAKEGKPHYDSPNVSITDDSAGFWMAKNTGVWEPAAGIDISALAVNFIDPFTYLWEDSNGLDLKGPTVGVAGIPDVLHIAPGTFDGSYKITVTATDGTTTLSDSTTLVAIREGDDSYIFRSGNENLNIPYDYEGINPSIPFPFTLTLAIARGIEILTAGTQIFFSIEEAFQCTAAMFGVDKVRLTALAEDNAFVQIKASLTANGDAVAYSYWTITKVKTGNPGYAPPLLVLTPEIAGFYRKKDGTYTNTSTRITAAVTNITGHVYRWFLEGSEIAAGSSMLTNGGALLTLPVQTFLDAIGTTKRVAQIRCDAVVGGVVEAFDITSQVLLIDGDDAIVMNIENENQTISCSPTGVPLAGSLVLYTKIFVAKGSLLLNGSTIPSVTYNAPVIKSGTGVGASVNVSGATGSYAIEVAAMSSPTIEITFSVTVAGVVYSKIFTANKSTNGATGVDGQSAPILVLSANTAGFTQQKTGAVTPDSTTLTASVQNLSGGSYSWTINGSYVGGGSSYNLTQSTFNSYRGGARFLPIRCGYTVGGIEKAYDVMSQYLLIDGDDSILPGLANENQTVSSDKDGVVAPGTTVTTRLFLAKGIALVTSGISFQPTSAINGILSSSPDSVGNYTLSVGGMNVNVNEVAIPISAIYNNVTYTKTLTISKSKAGANGNTGVGKVKGVGFIRSASTPATPSGGTFEAPTPTGWSDGIPSGTDPCWMSTRMFTSDGLAASGHQASWTTPAKIATTSTSVKFQFSVDQISWHDATSASALDVYMRTGTSTDGGVTWTYGAAVKIKGEQGTPGTPGTTSVPVQLTKSGYLYYRGANPPGPPSGTELWFGNVDVWSGNLNGWSPSANFDSTQKNWAISYAAITAPGSQTAYQNQSTIIGGILVNGSLTEGYSVSQIRFSSAFLHTSFDGLVTFTNAATSFANIGLTNVTSIDGGKITTGSLTLDRLATGTKYIGTGSFALGAGANYSVGGGNYAATAVFSAGYGAVGAICTGDTAALACVTSSGTAAMFSYNNSSLAMSICYGSGGFLAQKRSYGNSSIIDTGTSSYACGAWYDSSTGAYAGIASARIIGGMHYGAIIGYGTSHAIKTYGAGVGPFTGSHDAVAFSNEILEVGDIVKDIAIASKISINDVCTLVAKSTLNSKACVGVYTCENDGIPDTFLNRELIVVKNGDKYSETFKMILKPEFQDFLANKRFIAINSLGEGQVNVCGENGDIEIGDLITTSSTPGKGMKQADDLIHSYTVGKAREDVTFSSPSEIKMIACIYMCG